MCIAILAKPGKRLTEEQIKQCWKNNSDGAGFAYISNAEMVVVKELKKVKRFIKLYNKHEAASRNSPMLIHFRVRTHGEISISNTQPIQISNRCTFIHNGVIAAMPDNPVHSDTVMFKNYVLRYMNDGFHTKPKVLTMIERIAGFSKLVFLHTDGTYSIVQESVGKWEDDIWYSNESHKTWVVKKKNTTTVQTGVQSAYQSRQSCVFDTVPNRLLPTTSQTPAPIATVARGLNEINLAEKNKNNILLPYQNDMKCHGCKKPFFVSHKWFMIYGKHRVCESCMKDYADLRVVPTSSGSVVHSAGPWSNDAADLNGRWMD